MLLISKKFLLTRVLVYYNIWLYNVFFRGLSNCRLLWDVLNTHFFISFLYQSATLKTASLFRLFRCLCLNTLCQFNLLTEIGVSQFSGVFFQKFFLLYVLTSVLFNYRFNVKVILISEQAPLSLFAFCVQTLPSITSLYSNANWLEREVWDMFGLVFVNHPDLRRILTDYGFYGHSLLKLFPLTGTVDVFYSDISKRIIYRSVELTQVYRYFNFDKF